jgi:hypothetical protein
MPIYRGPDGKIIEERTKRIRDDELTTLANSASSEESTKGASAKSTSGSEDLTRIVGGQESPASNQDAAASVQSPESAQKQAQDEEKTVLFEMGDNLRTSESTSVVTDPVVAWLAVIKGPGVGNVLACGYGSNSIGRGGGARVNVDFGDAQISRGEHSILTYDPRGRKYYIQHGSGNHLTYLLDQPVLTPTELLDRAEITIGETTLMFIPLCGDNFDWQDLKDGSTNAST